MACSSNLQTIDLPPGIDVHISESSTFFLPSRDVVIVTQSIYWPLHARPIDWILNKKADNENDIDSVLNHLISLQFHNDFFSNNDQDQLSDSLRRDLLEEKTDWFSQLSGGQKSKVVSIFNLIFFYSQFFNELMKNFFP